MDQTQQYTKPAKIKSGSPVPLDLQPYDKRKLSYANTFENPLQRITIQTIEMSPQIQTPGMYTPLPTDTPSSPLTSTLQPLVGGWLGAPGKV